MTTTPAPQTPPAGPPGFPKGKWSVDGTHSRIGFAVKHYGINTFRGFFRKFQVDIELDESAPEKAKLEARVEAVSFESGVPRMEEEVRSPSFLDVAKWPQIVFKSKRVEYLGERNYRVVGDLTIRDVTKEVPLQVILTDKIQDTRNNHRIGYTATTTINRMEFGTTWNEKLPGGTPMASHTVNLMFDGELVRPLD